MSENHLPPNRIVSFIDILGFSDLVTRMEKEPDKYKLIERIFNETSATQEVMRKYVKTQIDFLPEVEQTLFSDCVVISAPVQDSDIMADAFIVYQTLDLSSRLMMDGVFVRGGISRGWCYHKGNIVFGQGLINAYGLEQTASYPRVILSDDITKKIFSEMGYNDDIQRDTDGCWYIDVIGKLLDGDIISKTLNSNYQRENLIACRNHILEGLIYSKDKPYNVKNKYNWLANKFNSALKRLQQENKISSINEYLIEF